MLQPHFGRGWAGQGADWVRSKGERNYNTGVERDKNKNPEEQQKKGREEEEEKCFGHGKMKGRWGIKKTERGGPVQQEEEEDWAGD